MKKYSRDQILTLAAATLFLIGAVFMLVNTFGGQTWSFAVGLSTVLVASAIAIVSYFDNKRRVANNLVETASTVSEPSPQSEIQQVEN